MQDDRCHDSDNGSQITNHKADNLIVFAAHTNNYDLTSLVQKQDSFRAY